MSITILIIFIYQFTGIEMLYQQPTNLHEIKLEKDCLILMKDKIRLDTLCINSVKGDGIRKNQIIDDENVSVIIIQKLSGAIDSFIDFYYLIEKWSVKNNKFNLDSSLKIPLGNCYNPKLRIKLNKEGIKWTYRTSFLKKEKVVIPYSKLGNKKIYCIPCNDLPCNP